MYNNPTVKMRRIIKLVRHWHMQFLQRKTKKKKEKPP